jgi:hypothetical protein
LNNQWDMGLDVVWYLKGAEDLELTSKQHDGCDGLAVVAYADSDFANDKVTGTSVYGYVVYIGGVEMQDAQGYVARCTTRSTSSFCLVVCETVVNQDHEGWTMVKTKRAKRRAKIL